MMDLIVDEDLPYEYELLKNPEDFRTWWSYIEATVSRSLAFRSFVLQRATASLPRSYKIWKYYLDLRKLNAEDQAASVEYENTFGLYDQALEMLDSMPRIWLDYLELRIHAIKRKKTSLTAARRCFDKCLRALPTTQHKKVWQIYLEFAESTPLKVRAYIHRRFTEFDPAWRETCVESLIDAQCYKEATEMTVMILNDNSFESVKEKSRYQIWETLVELLVHHFPQELSHNVNYSADRLIRSALIEFPDQCGRLWVQLATYHIVQGEFELARDIFEEGITKAMTMRDFTQVFDSYVEFQENYISQMMSKGEPEPHLERYLRIFEQLMDRRPFLVNYLRLRQNPNDVLEWEKRVALWGENSNEVVETYNTAIKTINPKKANKFYLLWVKFAKFYESHGDLSTARIIFDKATKVPYKSVNELADLWIEWSEMELRQENFDLAIKVMEKATFGPRISKIDYFDETKSPQERLHKSMKAWSFYLDLVESTSSIKEVKPLYDRVFELKIGTMLTFVNYAQLLEENNYFEEAFKVYERGIDLFSYPTVFELWNIYLQKAIDRKLGIERLRDLFEQALESCPPDLSRQLYILYAKLEEDRGLVRNAIKIYDRAVQKVISREKKTVYRVYISRVAENFGLPATRQIFQQALNDLDDEGANEIGKEFIIVEEKLGEIDRARALYGFVSQFNNPDDSLNAGFWQKWHEFEVQNGAEDTYKEMLRIKRSVKAAFERDINYLAKKEQQKSGSLDNLITGGIGFVKSNAQINAKQNDSEDTTHQNEDTVANEEEIEI